MTNSEHSVTIHHLWPLLTVRDIQRSVAFYRDVLGFSVVGQSSSHGKLFWCRVERGGASLMFQQAEDDAGEADGRDRGRGVSFYFLCDDAEAMYTELVARGVQLKPPSLACYGMWQLFVPEPDGYAICFESPTEAWAG